MTNDVTLAEYEALRATIRERGTARMWVILAGLTAWAALVVGLSATDLDRALTLVPLLILASAFEISFFIHTGVERVGRYLQVYYEDGAGWETTVMAYGARFPGGMDPLFLRLFAAAIGLNFLAVFVTASPGWAAVALIAHLALAWRLKDARRRSASQRSADLERFTTLKNASHSN